MLPFVQRLNHIRRENPALQVLTGLTFLETHNDGLIHVELTRQGGSIELPQGVSGVFSYEGREVPLPSGRTLL